VLKAFVNSEQNIETSADAFPWHETNTNVKTRDTCVIPACVRRRGTAEIHFQSSPLQLPDFASVERVPTVAAFGIVLAEWLLEGKRAIAVKTSSSLSWVQYAVIEALQISGRSESFVIAYGSEESLRDLIAAPCILATGFASRDAAMTSLRVQVAGQAA
jgi:hypothetical protein